MKKNNVLLGLAVIAITGLTACGEEPLELKTEKLELELGSELDTSTANYVEVDEKEAAEVIVDFSAVDTHKTGEYKAVITYKKQTLELPVVIKDTTAPEAAALDGKTVLVGTPIYASDVIKDITELSGSVSATFAAPEETESVEPEVTEVPEESLAIETVTVGNVSFENTYIIYNQVGEYDNVLTVADASGNSVEIPVHIIVGNTPALQGIEDMTVLINTNAENVDYMGGVTATDFKENDITDKISCDTSAVDLKTVGQYEIEYTVADEYGFEATKTAKVTVTEDKKAVTKKESSTKKENGKDTGSNSAGTSSAGNSSAGTSNSAGTSSAGNSSTGASNTGSNNSTGTSSAGNSSTGTSSAGTSSTGSNNSAGTSTDTSNNTSTNTEYDMFNPPSYEELVNQYGEAFVPGSGHEGLTEQDKEIIDSNLNIPDGYNNGDGYTQPQMED